MSEVKNLVPTISEWFAGKSIFITGATGFMGKVLVEKLLRDCPDIKQLYLLIRTKKGIEPHQRREDYINNIIFSNISITDPKQMGKIKVIKGDVAVDGLGISTNDIEEITTNTTIIFHCAANVRFDQPLKDAVNLNTLGTNRVLKLAEQMPQLKVFVHVSTAYCQCNEDVLEERGYKAPHSPMGIAQMTQLLDDDTLEYLTPRLLKSLPNTYAYAKALTEDLVSSYDGRIAIVIARPSIVTASWKEPFPGWVEGLNGPTGLMIGAARGVVRSMNCDPNLKADIIPVDIAINAIIATCWERGLIPDKKIQYRNIALPHENLFTWGECVETGKGIFHENPLTFALWYPNGSVKSNYWHHLFCVIFFHYLPAYCIDGLLILFRKKPILVNIQKRISQGLNVLQYYTTRTWQFNNEKFLKLQKLLHEDDLETFRLSAKEMDWYEYITNYTLGIRHYLLKEKPETLPQARKLLQRLYVADKLVSLLFYCLIIWFLYLYWNTILYSFEAMFQIPKDIFLNNGIFHRTPALST